MSLSGAAIWSDDISDPLRDIDDAKDAVRAKSGIEPNRLVLSKTVFRALCRHPKIREQFKYTSNASINADMLANYF